MVGIVEHTATSVGVLGGSSSEIGMLVFFGGFSLSPAAQKKTAHTSSGSQKWF
jgi:hypothetical protein